MESSPQGSVSQSGGEQCVRNQERGLASSLAPFEGIHGDISSERRDLQPGVCKAWGRLFLCVWAEWLLLY